MGHRKKRDLSDLFNVFQLILLAFPPVVSLPSWAVVVIHVRSSPLTSWDAWAVGTWSGPMSDRNITENSPTSCLCCKSPFLPPPAACWAEPPQNHRTQPCRFVPAPRNPTGAGISAPGLPLPQQPHDSDCIYGHLICASSQDQIHLQVLISFRLIEVQAHEVSVFDPQIGYESQSNRLIFTHSRCPGLQAAREKSMKSANDSQFIEQLPF